MRIISSLEELNINEKTAVALGNFDGIHIGHQKIMENALEAAEKNGLESLCFTFSNHPFNFIMDRDESDPAAVKLICSERQKIALIEEMGFDILVNVPFDEHIMKMRAKTFFDDILKTRLNAGYISVGFNYSYGARAEGKPDMLKAECARTGIGCSIQDAVKLDGKVVSSTLIREAISSGDMEFVRSCLGRPLSFDGRVEHGNRIGSANGFPTANIMPAADRALPPNGVYYSNIRIDGRLYRGVSNIGVKPTIGSGNDISIETYIFDFDGSLYGSDINVQLMHFSRPERRFGSRDELFEQISRDVAGSKAYFEN